MEFSLVFWCIAAFEQANVIWIMSCKGLVPNYKLRCHVEEKHLQRQMGENCKTTLEEIDL